MRKWIILILLLPTLWAGYWIFGSYGLKQAVSTWLNEREAEGWQVEYSDIAVRGFPNRFDLTLSDIQLTNPDTGISWSAPFFQLLSLSYKPQHQIAVWPKEQVLSTPFQKISITSHDMKASIVMRSNTVLEIMRGTMVANGIELVSSAGWDTKVEEFSSSIRQISEQNTYELASEINTLIPSEKLRHWLGNDQNLPASIENLSINMTADLTDPIGLTTIETARPQITALEISKMRANWGELLLRGAGAVTVDTRGNLDGELKVNAKNWREMLKMAVSSGTISGEIAQAAELGLSLIAQLNGSETSLDTTLAFRSGRMFLGPIPIGQAPNFKIR